MHKVPIIWLIFASLTVGCAAFPPTLKEGDPGGSAADRGTIIFSVAVDENELAGLDHLWLEVQRTDLPNQRRMVFHVKDHRFVTDFDHDATDPESAIRAVSLQLPAGDYGLLGWAGYAAGKRRHNWTLGSRRAPAASGMQQRFPYRFAVSRSEALYLGRIRLTIQQGEHVAVEIVDKMAADVQSVAGRTSPDMRPISRKLFNRVE